MELAGLSAKIMEDSSVELKWLSVKDWTEQSRYEYGRPAKVVEEFFDAITDPVGVVLKWLKARW